MSITQPRVGRQEAANLADRAKTKAAAKNRLGTRVFRLAIASQGQLTHLWFNALSKMDRALSEIAAI